MNIIYKAIITQAAASGDTYLARDGDGQSIRMKRSTYPELSKEQLHLTAARLLIAKRWKYSPECLDEKQYELVGGWVGPAQFAWVCRKVKP